MGTRRHAGRRQQAGEGAGGLPGTSGSAAAGVVGGALMNVPLQEQLRLVQQAALLQPGSAEPLALPAAEKAAPMARRSGQGRASVARASELPPTKGFTSSSNKPLSSRFRGVCWNRKNKRWQAAINSSGKYLYLGSYLEEDEAAMAFDRAAIKLRGKKGKLNFSYEGYVDAQGNLLEDIKLPDGPKEGSPKKAAAATGDGSSPPAKRRRTARTGGSRAAAAAAVDAGDPAAAGAAAGGAGGGSGMLGFFGAGLSGITMADMKRFLGGGAGALGGGGLGGPTIATGAPPGAAPGLGGAAAAAALGGARGVTTGFLGSLPGVAGPALGGGSAFAAAAGLGGGPSPLPSGAAGLPAAAPLQLPGDFAPGPGAGWQGAGMAAFLPAIESQLGEGRSLARVVDPPALSGGAAGPVKGVVYAEPAPSGGGGATFGAALWDGSRLVDHGARGSLDAALETAASLAAGEDDLPADLSLRDLLGGPSGIVPRAASLALFQALGNWRGSGGGGSAGGADKDAAAAAPGEPDVGPPARRTRSVTGKGAAVAPAAAGGGGGGGAGKGAKRPRPQVEVTPQAAAGADEDEEEDLMLPVSTGARSGSFLRSFLGVGPLGLGGGSLTEGLAGGSGGGGAPDGSASGSGSGRGGGAFASLSKTPLGDMLRSIRSFTGRSSATAGAPAST